ncbi:MAG: hypothetical protein ACI4HI_11690 [Lachnospiraceae bacterium]
MRTQKTQKLKNLKNHKLINSKTQMELPLKEVLSILNLWMKKQAVASGMGIDQSTYQNKLKNNVISNAKHSYVCSRFNEADVERLNAWLQTLPGQLRNLHVNWSDDREEVIRQIRMMKPLLNLNYISEKYMGMTHRKFMARCTIRSGKGCNTSFHQQDIDRLNSALDDFTDIVSHLKAQ